MLADQADGAMTTTWAFAGTKWFAAIISAAWISIDLDIRILVVLLSIDFATSIINPNRLLAATLKRIAVTVILVVTVHWTYSIARTQGNLNIGLDVATIVCTFYIFGEVVRIISNCAEWADIPPALLDVLSKAEGMTGRERNELASIKRRQEAALVEVKENQKDAAIALKQARKATDALAETLPEDKG